ncbi:UNVERIFIED_ORG: hypothetical protein M2312_000433 [Rhizobium esperanzae]|nr:hypothetical protein RHECNPAF_122100160 [Rhizobium etli CNPAF512]MDH6645803.1 hypothetical protein [Rhizobium esperanzae]
MVVYVASPLATLAIPLSWAGFDQATNALQKRM